MSEPGGAGRPGAREVLRAVVAQVDEGAVEATVEQRAFVAGAVAALETVGVEADPRVQE